MKTILFDLDGTLLPMDQNKFVETYFGELAKKSSELGLDSGLIIKSIWAGTKAMVENDGSITNRDRFWSTFAELTRGDREALEPIFDLFYQNEFELVKAVTQSTPLAGACVEHIKDKGYRLVLATNPIFPRVATLARIRWAGLDASDFELITTYENACYSKPNPEYYRAILREIGCEAEECLMIGNDVREDMCAEKLGMSCFLLTDNLISGASDEITHYPHGNIAQLFEYVKRLPAAGVI